MYLIRSLSYRNVLHYGTAVMVQTVGPVFNGSRGAVKLLVLCWSGNKCSQPTFNVEEIIIGAPDAGRHRGDTPTAQQLFGGRGARRL